MTFLDSLKDIRSVTLKCKPRELAMWAGSDKYGVAVHPHVRAKFSSKTRHGHTNSCRERIEVDVVGGGPVGGRDCGGRVIMQINRVGEELLLPWSCWGIRRD